MRSTSALLPWCLSNEVLVFGDRLYFVHDFSLFLAVLDGIVYHNSMAEMKKIHRTGYSQARIHITDAMMSELGWEYGNFGLLGVVGENNEIHLSRTDDLFKGRLNIVSHYNAITIPWKKEGPFINRVRVDATNGVLTIKFYEEGLWVK